MTEDNDLVKKLRAAAKHPLMDNNCIADVFDVSDAADRIEQFVAANEALTEQLEAARLDAKEAEAYSVWLEGKLAKAADVIEWALIRWDEHQEYGVGMDGEWVPDARTALLELKGDKR